MEKESKDNCKNSNIIEALFETMNCSPLKEANSLALNWIREHDSFSGFVDNEFLSVPENIRKNSNQELKIHEISVSPATQEIIHRAIESSKRGHKSWSKLTENQRSQYLLRYAQNIEKNKELVAQVESMSSLKHLHQTKCVDVPNLIQGFHYNASLSELRNEFKDFKEIGLICVVPGENNCPLLSTSFRLSSVLAGGNAVLLLVPTKSCLSAFLLAELAQLSGLPPGTLNVLPVETIDDKIFPGVDKFMLNGSSSKCNTFIKLAAQQNIPCEFSALYQPAVIVYENADLHSACDGVLQTFFFNNSASVKVYVQQSIEKKFHDILEDKFLKISIGSLFSKTDMTSLVLASFLESMKSTIKEAKNMQLKVIELPDSNSVDSPEEVNGYSLLMPTLICNVPTTSSIFDKVRGPTIITTPFRTVKESIAMFNCNKNSSQVSLWTEKITVGLEVAYTLKTRTIWINSQNLWDASVVNGGIHKQGSSVDGGKEGFFNQLDIIKSNGENLSAKEDFSTYGAKATSFDSSPSIMSEKSLGHHIGGSYKANESKPRAVKDASKKIYSYVSNGSNSDIHSAVKAALNAQPKWDSISKYKKSEIFLKAAGALLEKKEVCASLLQALTGEDVAQCREEVEESALILRYCANHGVKYCGEITETIHGKVLQDRNPVGVIGIQCPDEKPLLSFVTLVISAISYGNTVAAIPSEKYPIPALKMCEILYSSGLLPGVVNVVNGDRAFLTRHLCLNLDVDAVWFSVDGASWIYDSCVTHPKRIFNCKEFWLNFTNSWSKKLKFSFESSESKSIYVPVGSIFAN